MEQVVIRECPNYIMEETNQDAVRLPREIYVKRLKKLQERIKAKGLDFAVLYGDREHFANIEYFSRYDCRFEEALFIVEADKKVAIVVGNEGEAYCRCIPYEVEVIRYKNFSLQGQPRDHSPLLEDVFAKAGIAHGTKVGLAGYKYFENPNWFDVPEYITAVLRQVVGEENLVNFTKELTGLPDGLRMTIESVEEIALIDAQASKVANVMRRMLKALRPGISELELSQAGKIDFAPQQTYSMVNFGTKSVAMGIKSPSPFVHLEIGGPMSMAFSQRGSLMCRAGFAAKNLDTIWPELRPMLESHLMVYWYAVARWYEEMKVGCRCADVYDTVAEQIGKPEFGFELNPGHYIGGDEWVNSEFRHDTRVRVHSGSHIQCDIIAASANPILSAICEDTVIVADSGLRLELYTAYPQLYRKICERQQMMREILGIRIHEDVLPMGGMNAVMFPFMLNTEQIFALKR